ncbi:MAG: hypothetical protein V4615_04255 [Bacteroidota bacterium]
MKKLTAEEKAKFITRPMKRQGYVRTLLMNMKPGDIILLELVEWKWKTKSPSFLCRRVEEDNTGWKFECEKIVQGGSGWIITRTK